MLFPYRIDTVFKHWPVANWMIMAITVALYFLSDALPGDTVERLVLGGTSPAGLIGHLFLHANLGHLMGNLLFLWVFGNAVCGMMNAFAYVVLYLGLGLIAAAAHLAFADAPAIGGSGAINGIVGLAVAMYPRNRVSMFWFFVLRAGTFELPLWVLAVAWFAFDAAGAHDIAYWAHVGGFVAGVLAGLVGLKLRWLTLTEFDHPSLADVFKAKTTKRARTDKWSWEEPMTLNDKES